MAIWKPLHMNISHMDTPTIIPLKSYESHYYPIINILNKKKLSIFCSSSRKMPRPGISGHLQHTFDCGVLFCPGAVLRMALPASQRMGRAGKILV